MTGGSRRRLGCLLACAVTVGLGLLSRRHPGVLPAAFGKYPGDALWTLMVFWGVGFLMPNVAIARLAFVALAFSFAIEFLKLWQLPWLVEARRTTAGHLVFGHVFSWQNLVAYAVGAALGLLIDKICRLALTSPRPTATSVTVRQQLDPGGADRQPRLAGALRRLPRAHVRHRLPPI